MEKKLLQKQLSSTWLKKIQDSGTLLFGPKRRGNQCDFDRISDVAEITQDYIQTAQSVKFLAFPKVEELFRFRQTSSGMKIQDRDLASLPAVVVFGVRPCDASAMASLTSIFTTDYEDSQFKTRLEKMTVIGMSCGKSDEYCFCTSIGGNPGNTAGSDVLLTKLDSGDYLVEILTEKGQKVVSLAQECFAPAPEIKKEDHLAPVKKYFAVEELTQKLPQTFYNNLWAEHSLRCLGCGACAYVCPTCACFTIEDEGTQEDGTRLRCWDSCGFAQFTLHTSGHNPREVQSQRWRQRIMHKFSYMPDRLKVLGCCGCGRCSRSCPVDMNLMEHLTAILEAKL